MVGTLFVNLLVLFWPVYFWNANILLIIRVPFYILFIFGTEKAIMSGPR